ALDVLRERGLQPRRPLGIGNFSDEEGARFGVACDGSRLLTGALPAERALGLTDADGVSLAEALQRAGRHPGELGADPEALRRIAAFVELHVEQGRGLVDLGSAVAIATSIWPHGRFRAELPGAANHAGTTALRDRHDPTLAYARLVLAARDAAERHGVVATCGKVRVEPNGVNAIPSHVTAWIDARGADAGAVRRVVAELDELVTAAGGTMSEESWTDGTSFPRPLADRIAHALGEPPRLATGAGHDAGVLGAYGIPAAMLFVRNPTGVSHSPAEFAERDDCLAGVDALAAVLVELLTAAA
ncbi:MAG: beta-ureidopropionase / N-carbamoyl-L-amino-acid hydrolase, partial [Pseudonocardiales bacterium]|nr:beta-ureidopropionase / N-carbamoyl-L-amino-acid hydrolase [Pseudonocardiales bacterium]